MDNYFDEIVDSLSINDLGVLGLLTDYHANAKFKAIKRSRLNQISNLSIADFRKVVQRLEMTKLISVVTGQKEHKIFITKFGQTALSMSLQKIEKEKEINQVNLKSDQSPIYTTRVIKKFGNKDI